MNGTRISTTAFAQRVSCELSWTRKNVSSYLLDYGSSYGPGVRHIASRSSGRPSGALVFGAGTVQWSWGLDGTHDGGGSTPDTAMRQATVNFLADMGAQPGSSDVWNDRRDGVQDTTAPRSTITSPASGRKFAGRPGDGDRDRQRHRRRRCRRRSVRRWRLDVASGDRNTSWTYSWTPSVVGTVTLKSSAVDDSGNVEAPSPGVPVTVTTNCPCTIWTTAAAPAVASNPDANPVELGVRFRSDMAGFITGIRFYKGAQNTGPHTGKLYTATGTVLASATFTSETASGWQQVTFASPVSIAANTTYVASYYTASGFYSITRPYFTTSTYTPPLRALADGDGGGNGVYRYGTGGGFPTSSANSTNYWVDVVFTTTAAAAAAAAHAERVDTEHHSGRWLRLYPLRHGVQLRERLCGALERRRAYDVLHQLHSAYGGDRGRGHRNPRYGAGDGGQSGRRSVQRPDLCDPGGRNNVPVQHLDARGDTRGGLESGWEPGGARRAVP